MAVLLELLICIESKYCHDYKWMKKRVNVSRSSFSVLNDIYGDLVLKYYKSSINAGLKELGILMLQASESSPYFLRDIDRGQMRPTEVLIGSLKYWWHFLDIIAKGSSSDASTSVCLSLLHFLWDFPPYTQQHIIRLKHRYDPEQYTAPLSRAALAGKLWLAGDSQESARSVHLLYQSIRGALVFASPYYLFEDNDAEVRRSNGVEDYYRPGIIKAIADMLEIEKDISTYSEGNNPSLILQLDGEV
jgi:hypothetical protein